MRLCCLGHFVTRDVKCTYKCFSLKLQCKCNTNTQDVHLTLLRTSHCNEPKSNTLVGQYSKPLNRLLHKYCPVNVLSHPPPTFSPCKTLLSLHTCLPAGLSASLPHSPSLRMSASSHLTFIDSYIPTGNCLWILWQFYVFSRTKYCCRYLQLSVRLPPGLTVSLSNQN